MSRLADYVVETASNPGTGTVSLAGAPTGRRSFMAALGAGAAYYYITDGVQAEWGSGTVAAGTPNTLSRDTVLGNTAGTTAKLNFTGTITVYNALPASVMMRFCPPATNAEVLAGTDISKAVTPAALKWTRRYCEWQVFTQNGNFTVPTGVNYVFVRLVGGGGGSGYNNGAAAPGGSGGGGAGGYAEGLYAVTSGTSISVVVGQGGVAGTVSNDGTGGQGGTSSFGAYISAVGGGGSRPTVDGMAGGGAGWGIGGSLNISGGDGGDGSSAATAQGGASAFGGGGRAGANYGSNGTAYGSGAGGCYYGAGPGGAGANGLVIVEW